MSTQQPSDFVGRLLDTVAECLTPDVARALVNLPSQPDVQAQIDEFAEKSTAGVLTPAEQAEYRDIAHALDLINILQEKARERLATTAPE